MQIIIESIDLNVILNTLSGLTLIGVGYVLTQKKVIMNNLERINIEEKKVEEKKVG
jgi:hypothetical protein